MRAEAGHSRTLLCFAQGHDGAWEAVCLDFDLAVQGASFAEVQDDLERAIALYVEAAHAESPATRERLLSRRAPLGVRARWVLRFLASALGRRGADGGCLRHGYTVPCHA